MTNSKIAIAKTRKDKIWKWVTFSLSLFLLFLFIAILIFIIISAIPGFEYFGIENILGTTNFNLSSKMAGIWSPIAITLLLTFGAVLIATPIGIKTASFIKFRLSKKYQKTASIIAQSLNGIPSVIFGLFALSSLGNLVTKIFGVDNGAYTIINAVIMLSFMILPTIISLTLNSYDGVSVELISNPISLGTSKTFGIYKIYKKQARNGIIVGVIIAIGRAFGETMALSMILTSESYSIIGDGIGVTLTSNLGTLGSVIATNMFSESGGPELRGVLYSFGIFLFIIVMLLNAVILVVTRKKKFRRKSTVVNFIGNAITWVPRTISSFFLSFFVDKDINPNYNYDASINEFVQVRCSDYKLKNIRSYWWIFWEYVCAIITFGFLLWIGLDIIIGGVAVMVREPNYSPDYLGYNSTAFKYGIDTTGQAVVNTIIIIFVSLLISLPIALMIAIYLNEYAKNEKVKKIIFYFVDCLGSSPSIIFGMFGLALFIELLGISMSGTMGRSLLAGALTISIVILPTLIRTLQQALANVPDLVRINAYSLGCTKWETIWKVVFKHAYKSIISSIVLAIGRIIAETAPLYLTAGLTSVSGIGLLMPGQTLTTRIYAQLGEVNLSASRDIQYECAFIALSIVILLIIIGNYLIPNSQIIKNNIICKFMIIKNIFKKDNKKYVKKYKKQLVDNFLFLTAEQVEKSNINKKYLKYILYDKKILRLIYVSDDDLLKIKNGFFIGNFI